MKGQRLTKSFSWGFTDKQEEIRWREKEKIKQRVGNAMEKRKWHGKKIIRYLAKGAK